MQFNVLGPLEVSDSKGARPLRGGRPRVLLHLLLLNRRVVVPVEVLADRVWGEDQPLDAANAVYQLVSYLRRALGDEGRSSLITGSTGYMLDVSEEQVDAGTFERLVQSVLADLSGPGVDAAAQAVAHADSASRLWRGEPYAESSAYDWAAGDIQRLKDGYLLLQEARLDALLRLGKHREVLLEAKTLVCAYPLREQLHGHLSLALYRSGRQSEALDVHRKLRKLLADELGIDPAAALQHLERQILNQDPALDWRPPTEAVSLASDVQPTAPTRPGPVPPDVPAPAYRTRMWGRESDVDRVGELLGSKRLVTLAGPPGVGKSRLAAELVAASSAVHRWFADLGDVTEDDVVAGTVATKLSVEGQFPKDPTDRLIGALDAPESLLVLDSCEGAFQGVATFLGRLLEATDHLRVLVTSRRPLQLPGETVYRLDPLPVPERTTEFRTSPAAQLFLDRAEAATGRAWDDPAELGNIHAIVREIDGLPLAVELAAANLDVLGPTALRSRLRDQLDYLVSPEAGAHHRHASLRAAIHSSFQLLADEEAGFLTRLAVFPGSFDLESAAAVTAMTGADAYRLVASLVRQSLIVADADGRYRVLAPVREFLGERFESTSDSHAVRRRHAHHVAGSVAPLASGTHRQSQKRALRELRQYLGDARAALDWCVAHDEPTTAAAIASAYAWFWTLAGMADEGITRLTQVRELMDRCEPDVVSAPVYATLLRNLGLLANPAGRLDVAVEACAAAAEMSRRIGDWDGAARALLTLGIARWARGEYDAAARIHDEAADLYRHGASDWSHMAALVLRARTALDSGEHDAERRIDEAVEVSSGLGDRHMGGLAMLIQARFALLSGRPQLAEVSARQALEGWRSIEYREGEIGALNLLGRIALDTDGPAEAEPLLTEAMQIAAAAGHPGGQCETVESLALMAAAAGRFEHAYLLYCVASLERQRVGAAAPAADLHRLLGLEESCTEVLGAAAELVRARARLMSFADVLDGLLRR